jgi:glycerol kinase
MTVVALDAGTSSVRALAIDDAGNVVGIAQREFTQYFPQPGWVEHDPVEITEAARNVLTEIAGRVGPIAAVGITNQRETIVAWDRRTGQPLHRAIVWQDRRTAERCEQLSADGHLALVRQRSGLVLDPYFSGSKAQWLLNEGGVEKSTHLALGTIDSWLAWQLTGGAHHVTDPSNASRTMLCDINAVRWDNDLCELFGVPMAALPEIRPTSSVIGPIVDGFGVATGTALASLVGDQQGALFGQACLSPGMTKNTYGTGSFVLMNAGHTCPAVSEGMLTTIGWQLSDGTVTYALEGAIFATGAAIQWLRDGLGIISEASQVGPLAASVPDTGGVVLVPAFAGLGAPWWDPYARGTIVGITRGTTRAHIARAIVESMVYQTRDVVDAMSAAVGQPLAELRVDGGAAVMDLLCQLQADQLDVPVARPTVTETTARGAAFLAGLATGVWSSTDDVSAAWTPDARFVASTTDRSAIDSDYAQWRRGVQRSLDWARP